MLAALDPPATHPIATGSHGHHPDGSGSLTISPLPEDNGRASNVPPGFVAPDAQNPYSHAYIRYNPEFSTPHTPPVVVLSTRWHTRTTSTTTASPPVPPSVRTTWA
jgi:hypothetical protein